MKNEVNNLRFLILEENSELRINKIIILNKETTSSAWKNHVHHGRFKTQPTKILLLLNGEGLFRRNKINFVAVISFWVNCNKRVTTLFLIEQKTLQISCNNFNYGSCNSKNCKVKSFEQSDYLIVFRLKHN